MKEIVFTSGKHRIAFSARTGALRSFRRGACEHLKPARELFALTLDDGTRVHSGKFRSFSAEKGLFRFRDYPDHPEWGVTLRIRARKGGFYFRYRFENMSVRLLDPLIVICADGGQVLAPYSEGVLSDDTHNRHKYFPRKHYYFTYPGRCQMQFLAHLLADGGIYFAALDKRHSPKLPQFYGDGRGDLRLTLETFGSHGPYWSTRMSITRSLLSAASARRSACGRMLR